MLSKRLLSASFAVAVSPLKTATRFHIFFSAPPDERRLNPAYASETPYGIESAAKLFSARHHCNEMGKTSTNHNWKEFLVKSQEHLGEG